MADFNPYAAPNASRVTDQPLAGPDDGRGVWRDGEILVMSKVARLPLRCVKCNEPATNRLKRTLYWHNPLFYLLIFFPGLLIYVIVALIVRKSVKFEVPLCDEHRAKRAGAIRTSWFLGLAGLATCFVPSFAETELTGPFVAGGLAVIFFSLIYGAIRSQVVTPLKIDATHAWIKKVGPAYLAELPPLPPPFGEPGKPAPVFEDDL